MGSEPSRADPDPPRYLVRFGYDGSGFAGSARQPGLRTVEGEIRAGVLRLGISPSLEGGDLAISSRTDRGVHARANALTLRSPLRATALLRALNGLSPDLTFTHAARVPDGFRPRSATQRWYRYFERPADSVPPAWIEAARTLTGRIDIRSFARGMPASTPTFRDVGSVAPRIEARWLVLDVRARAFAWGMVRKIVTALREVEAGRLASSTLSAAALGKVRIPLPLAEPERLVLWETSYPIAWEAEHRRLARQQARRFRSEILGASARARILSSLENAVEVDRFPSSEVPTGGR
ncbi:MAG TPA: hypothetical protein VGS23_03895 [Thermoplasmata archaeon]|nr:hypothetical protein [Thermoplasmata archaeon]